MISTEELFDEALTGALARWSLPIQPDQLERLRAYYLAVIEANRTMNLTRIVDPVEAAVKHFADSLALLVWARECGVVARTVLDVGTGAGFPALPLAVMRPEWSITAIDATKKKIDSVRRMCKRMELANLTCHQAHSLHWRPDSPFDLVTFRALARFPDALEQTARHVAPGGWLVAYKTASLTPAEQRGASEFPGRKGFSAEPSYAYKLALADATLDRVLLVFRKNPIG